MFTDPITATYNGVSKSLTRATGLAKAQPRRDLGSSRYSTADGEFELFITQTLMNDDTTRSEITLARIVQDADGPFVGNYRRLPNRVTLAFEVNNLRYQTSTDIGLLQAALISLVDSTFRGRLIGGEV